METRRKGGGAWDELGDWIDIIHTHTIDTMYKIDN